MMRQQEQDLTFDTTSTNYLDSQKFEEFIWALERLEPFTCETGRPPMNAKSYEVLFRVLYGTEQEIQDWLVSDPKRTAKMLHESLMSVMNAEIREATKSIKLKYQKKLDEYRGNKRGTNSR